MLHANQKQTEDFLRFKFQIIQTLPLTFLMYSVVYREIGRDFGFMGVYCEQNRLLVAAFVRPILSSNWFGNFAAAQEGSGACATISCSPTIRSVTREISAVKLGRVSSSLT